VACLLLLVSSRPVPNLIVFASVTLLVYAVLSGVALEVLTVATASAHLGTVRGWLSVAVGAAFLAGALASFRQRRRVTAAFGSSRGTRREDTPAEAELAPGWMRRLVEPELGFVAGAAAVLALLSPNAAIVGCGAGSIATAEVSGVQQLAAVVLLLAAAMVDFAVPSFFYAVSGDAGRLRLRQLTPWMVGHHRVISVVVLVALALLFAVRGLVQLLG
jgi:hypothetical protein